MKSIGFLNSETLLYMLPITDCHKIRIAHCKFFCHCLAPFFSCYKPASKGMHFLGKLFLKIKSIKHDQIHHRTDKNSQFLSSRELKIAESVDMYRSDRLVPQKTFFYNTSVYTTSFDMMSLSLSRLEGGGG